MTKNQNLRVDLWRWNRKQVAKRHNSPHQNQQDFSYNEHQLEKFPLFTILPFETAKRLMQKCKFDLELFARNHISISNKHGNSIRIHQQATSKKRSPRNTSLESDKSKVINKDLTPPLMPGVMLLTLPANASPYKPKKRLISLKTSQRRLITVEDQDLSEFSLLRLTPKPDQTQHSSKERLPKPLRNRNKKKSDTL